MPLGEYNDISASARQRPREDIGVDRTSTRGGFEDRCDDDPEAIVRRSCHPPRFSCRYNTRERHTIAAYIVRPPFRSEEHTSELQSLMRISYAVFCLKKKKTKYKKTLH